MSPIYPEASFLDRFLFLWSGFYLSVTLWTTPLDRLASAWLDLARQHLRQYELGHLADGS